MYDFLHPFRLTIADHIVDVVMWVVLVLGGTFTTGLLCAGYWFFTS